MSEFKFIINQYFFLPGDQIGIIGEMQPNNFPIVSSKYKVKLIKNDKILHFFQRIGEEIPTKESGAQRIRAFRTSDNIKSILTSSDLKDLYIIGEEK